MPKVTVDGIGIEIPQGATVRGYISNRKQTLLGEAK